MKVYFLLFFKSANFDKEHNACLGIFWLERNLIIKPTILQHYRILRELGNVPFMDHFRWFLIMNK